MSVTLETLKLSGWLNSLAPCRLAREGIRNKARYGPGGERAVGVVVVQAACREELGWRFGRRARTLL